MTIDELQRIVAQQPPQPMTSERITLSMARNPDGWITWFALQADAADERARKAPVRPSPGPAGPPPSQQPSERQETP